MRDIRFRAWDVSKLPDGTIRKVMHSNNDLMCWGEVPSPMFATGFADEKLKKGELWVWMQFTGLKDKNEKEIYEGDIVRAKSKFVSVNYEVYWEDRLCQFRLCARHDKQYDKTHDLYIWADEVIGNIYENPELLGS